MSSAIRSSLRSSGHMADAPSGSRTITITHEDALLDRSDGVEADVQGEGEAHIVGNIRLRGAPPRRTQRVVWDDDVVDNEGCGRKSSKICCIYHKPRAFDESSSEEDSSDDDSDASTCDGHGHGAAGHRPRHGKKPRRKQKEDEGEHEPNAYEKQPSNKGKERA